MRISDWSSDVCSSDLILHREGQEVDIVFAGQIVAETSIMPDPGQLMDRRITHVAIDENDAFAAARQRRSERETGGRLAFSRPRRGDGEGTRHAMLDRKSTRLNSSN